MGFKCNLASTGFQEGPWRVNGIVEFVPHPGAPGQAWHGDGDVASQTSLGEVAANSQEPVVPAKQVGWSLLQPARQHHMSREGCTIQESGWGTAARCPVIPSFRIGQKTHMKCHVDSSCIGLAHSRPQHTPHTHPPVRWEELASCPHCLACLETFPGWGLSCLAWPR